MIQNILGFLETSAEIYPDKTAFRDLQSEYSFKELLRRSRIAGSFLSTRTERLRPVPVLAEKSADVAAVFMGIVAAGCFYVLIDPSQPESRVKKILDTLSADILITDCDMDLHDYGEVISLPALIALPETALDEERLAFLRGQAADTDPLYGIFTSGSTGEPKGVVVCHRSVIDFITHFTELFGITHEDVIGNQAPFDFDVSVKDIYSGLAVGATVELIPKKLFSIPMELLDYLCDRNITTLVWAVSALCMISTLGGFSYKVPSAVRKILFSGEVMPVKHLNIWREHLPEALFVNLYGPTEITCNCTYYVIDREFRPGDVIPAGIPFPNEKVWLMDENAEMVKEPGRLGEICVAGTALALGYYRNPEKTKEVFVQNPFNDCYPELMYRTGDLAYYGDDGLLYFESRKDYQIKHMGHRIELGEIEHALEMVEGVGRAVCVYMEEKHKIAVFYEGTAERQAIAKELGTHLPAYMIPNVYRKTEVFPVTKNGKTDRKKLLQTLEDGERRRTWRNR